MRSDEKKYTSRPLMKKKKKKKTRLVAPGRKKHESLRSDKKKLSFISIYEDLILYEVTSILYEKKVVIFCFI